MSSLFEGEMCFLSNLRHWAPAEPVAPTINYEKAMKRRNPNLLWIRELKEAYLKRWGRSYVPRQMRVFPCSFPFHVNFFDRYHRRISNHTYLRANKVKSLKEEEDAVVKKQRKLQLWNQKALGFRGETLQVLEKREVAEGEERGEGIAWMGCAQHCTLKVIYN